MNLRQKQLLIRALRASEVDALLGLRPPPDPALDKIQILIRRKIKRLGEVEGPFTPEWDQWSLVDAIIAHLAMTRTVNVRYRIKLLWDRLEDGAPRRVAAKIIPTEMFVGLVW